MSREAFEAWSRSQEGGGFTIERYDDPECNEYVHYATQFSWLAWRSASASNADQIRKLREALERIAAIELQMYGADWAEIEEAHQIARAALKETE
jgi:hypothetical protein